MHSEKSISGVASMQGKRCTAPAERREGSAVSLLLVDLINLTDAVLWSVFRGNTESISNSDKKNKPPPPKNGKAKSDLVPQIK